MSITCVIVDDEKPARERLKRLLAGHNDLELVGEAANAVDAARLIDEKRPQLCFLDVQMPEGDGFDVLRRVRRMPRVIFTTAYDRYAVRAFEVKSLDYLLKPFSKRRFAEAVERARRSLSQAADPAGEIMELLQEIRRDVRGTGGDTAAVLPRRITARRGSKVVLLDPGEVSWFEAEETLVFARTGSGRFIVERTLSEIEEELSPEFFRAHRRYLVNVSRIAEILPGDAGTYRIVMSDDDRSPIALSRRQARKLRELIPW